MSLCIFRYHCLRLWYLLLIVPAVPVAADPMVSDADVSQPPPAPRELPWSAVYDLELDYEQGYTQRVVADVGETRWAWWAFGGLLLTRDEPAPAGMVEREYYLHNPLEDTAHRVGVSAGPLVFGPVLIRGGYRRVMDPSGGGVLPSAVTDTTAILLDGAREPSSWDGVAVSADTANSSLDRIGVDAGVAYLYNPDRAHIALGHLGISPAGGRFGRLSVIAGASELMDGGRSFTADAREESWFRDAPHPQTAVIRGIAASYRLNRGGWDDEYDIPVPLFLLVEGHRQGYSWRPNRHAGQVVARVGPPRLRIALRGVAVETGFLDADLTSPTRAEYHGLRVEGTERLPTLREENRPTLAWSGEFEKERRWDDGLPASPDHSQRYAVTFHSGGILSQCGVELQRPDDQWTVSSALSTPDRWDLPFAGRVSAEYRWIPYAPDRRIAVESSFRRTVTAAKGDGSRRTVLRWRVVGETASSRGGLKRYAWDHFAVVEVPLGDSAAVSLHVGVENAAIDEVEYTGAARFHWSVAGVLAPEEGDTTLDSTSRE